MPIWLSPMRFFVLPAILFAIAALALPQMRVDPRFTHHRVLCVLPLAGSGAEGDPRRPDHIPAKLEQSHPDATGILAFAYELSDDGNWALAEIVALDRKSLEPLLNDRRPGVWAAEKGRVSKQEIEAVFRRYKKSIDLDHFGALVR